MNTGSAAGGKVGGLNAPFSPFSFPSLVPFRFPSPFSVAPVKQKLFRIPSKTLRNVILILLTHVHETTTSRLAQKSCTFDMLSCPSFLGKNFLHPTEHISTRCNVSTKTCVNLCHNLMQETCASFLNTYL